MRRGLPPIRTHFSTRLCVSGVKFQPESNRAFATASHGTRTILHDVKGLMLIYAGLLSAAVIFATNWLALIPWRRAKGLGARQPNRRHKKGAREGRLLHQHGKTVAVSQVDRP